MFNNDRSGADNLRMLRNNQGSVEKNYESVSAPELYGACSDAVAVP